MKYLKGKFNKRFLRLEYASLKNDKTIEKKLKALIIKREKYIHELQTLLLRGHLS